MASSITCGGLSRSHGGEPRKIVTDKLRSYGVAHRELMSGVIHDNSQYANNRAEQSHEPTRVRGRVTRSSTSYAVWLYYRLNRLLNL